MEQQILLHNNKWVPLNKFLGQGSYGSVSIGVRQSDASLFAVKSASKDSISSIQALENEIRALRLLSSTSSSPFIVGYYGDDETTTHRNLHLEYLPNGDVAKSCGVSGGDVELIRSYTWCLVMALKDVHDKGIVHCDVKASNVLVGSTKGVVKLSDFGSSIIKGVDDNFNQIVPRGSPLWMAPEVVRRESQGCESDVWSLGCTVIEMLTGLPAWRDCGPATLFKIGYSDKLPEYPEWLPEIVKDFLNKCLVRNPKERWSCDQLLQHPFLLPVPVPSCLIDDVSPRSVFDWQNLDFSDDDDDDDDVPSSLLSCDDEIMDRIGKLASSSRVNWESDGWVEVRGVGEEKEEVSAGTSCEYSEFKEGQRGVFQEDDCPTSTWNINSNENGEIDDESVIRGEDSVGPCNHGDSSGGVMIEQIETSFVQVLLFIDDEFQFCYSYFLCLFVLHSYTRNNKILLRLNFD